MPVFIIIWSIAIGINLTISALNLYVWSRRRQEISYLIFSTASFLAALMAFFEMQQSTADGIQSYADYLRFTTFIVGSLLISIIWFVDVYLKSSRRWLTVTITLLWTIILIANIFSPYSTAFTKITELKHIIMPWGEILHIADGIRNPWSYLADFTSLIILIFFIDSGFRHYRRGNKKRAIVIGGGSTFFMIGAAIHTPLVDMAIIETPYLISIAFLMIIIAMGLELGDDIIKTSVLTKTVQANERRWQMVMENVQLMVVGVDMNGKVNYVNPFFLQLSGYQTKEVIGKHWVDNFIPLEYQQRLNSVLNALTQKQEIPHGENPILLKNGQERIIFGSKEQL